jgi:PAS domain S-box-containing protein
VRFDTTLLKAKDTVRHFEFQLTPLFNDDKEVTHIVTSGFDVTERVEFDAKQRVFGHAFESSLTAMVITDATKPENPIIYANPGFLQMTGYSAEEFIGKNCRFLQGPESDQKTISTIRNAVHKKFWNELAITPVRNDKGELANFIGVQFDVTQHSKVEQQLEQARDIAEAANSAKSSFVANMSHEIRTPLTTIVGMTEMLLDQEPDKSKHETLQLIHQSSRHLASLVNDVLDLSKIEANKLESERSAVAPMKVIEDVAASMHYRAKEKGLSFDVKYEGMIPETIMTDPVRLRQVLFNLGGNAIKFTDKGGVIIRCQLIDRQSGSMLRITVEDTGIGFENSEVNSLFEQFKQVDDSLTRRRGGSGLGLFISRRIVELIGGRLWASGTPGEGSVFTLELPTGNLSSRTMIDPQSIQSEDTGNQTKEGTEDVRLDGKRILVAEDTRGIQMLLKRFLEIAGAQVEVADDGQMAMAILNEGDVKNPLYDLFVLDMHMPRLSGYDTAAAIRKLGISKPIIALTASAMRGDREKCLASGCDDYLTKPIDRQKLLETITRLLGISSKP